MSQRDIKLNSYSVDLLDLDFYLTFAIFHLSSTPAFGVDTNAL